jgi:hypothetical protein
MAISLVWWQIGAMTATNTATLRTKLPFWLLLGVLSVAIAEVSVASAPFAFVNPFETVFLVGFYGSHLLVLAWWTYRRGWPTLSALWFAGVLFGLYEFYITKVLWSPPWGDVISLAHIDVVSFIVLAFFWHPFMAFILPIAAAERIGTTTRWTADLLPSPRRWVVLGLAVVAAMTHGMLTGSPVVALVSTASAGLAVAVSSWWWRKERHRSWNLRELLPTDRQGKWILLILALQYLIFIPAWTPDKMPPVVGHVVVWLLYAGFAMLLDSGLRQSQRQSPAASTPLAIPPGSRILLAVIALLGLTIAGALAPAELGFIPVWGIAIWVGLRMFYKSVRSVLGQTSPQSDQLNTEARLP